MGRGDVHPSESEILTDPQTGAKIRRVTAHPSIHHHPFFLAPAFDDAGRRLYFVSHRTGTPQVFAEDRITGQLVQLTDRDGLDEWSIHPSHDGRWLYYTARGVGYRLDLDSFQEEPVVHFPDSGPKRVGGVAGEMGTTALSHDDRWWAFRVPAATGQALMVVDTHTGHTHIAAHGPAIGHIQFCPDDANLISYAGPHTARLRVVQRDGSNDRLIYQQQPDQWVTHEVWIPGRRQLAFIDWPHAIRVIDPETEQVSTLAEFNFWHASFDRSGRYLIADTNCPDVGLQLVDLTNKRHQTICFPRASNAGSHWAGPFPYGKGPIQVYAPQHTHPHPVFAPDGTSVIYTSDVTGQAHVYEVSLNITDHMQ